MSFRASIHARAIFRRYIDPSKDVEEGTRARPNVCVVCVCVCVCARKNAINRRVKDQRQLLNFYPVVSLLSFYILLCE